MLSDQGGQAEALDDFRWYEEGGAGGTIHGETVLLGSAYFMRRQNVRLPKELKVPSGLFLAVDGQLTAIFALRYQPSRNVDWALRALRRNRVTPVLAVRGAISPRSSCAAASRWMQSPSIRTCRPAFPCWSRPD